MAKSGCSIGMAAHVLRGIRASRLASWLRHSGSFSGEEGSNLVESALAYAILIPLLLAAIEFGFMFYTYQTVADASRKAARWAAVHGSSATTACTGGTASQTNCNASTTNIQAYVQGLNYPGVNFSASSVTVAATFYCVDNAGNGATWVLAGTTCPSGTDNPGGPANAPGGEVQVAVTYPFTIGYWPSLRMTVNISSTGSMVITY
jgi:Flp pilus assembly protein TadG